MNEKTQLLQVRLVPSVIAKVKELGNGKFAAGLAVLLAQTTPKGKPAKEDDPLHPGDTYQAKAKRAREAHANSPETRKNKIRNQLEHYIKRFYNLHRGIIDETTMFETQIFDAKGNHLAGAGEDVRIMDYITQDELDAWVPGSVANYRAEKAGQQTAAPTKPRTQTKQLTPEALLGYGFKRTPPDMSDEAVEGINAEWAPGGEHYGDDPIREMEK
jgi:hypothetical protein